MHCDKLAIAVIVESQLAANGQKTHVFQIGASGEEALDSCQRSPALKMQDATIRPLLCLKAQNTRKGQGRHGSARQS
jgi:hypothetical protein